MNKIEEYIVNHYETELIEILITVRKVEELLGPEDDWVEEDRRFLFEIANFLTGNQYTFTKPARIDNYTATAHASPDAIERLLDTNGYDRNLVSFRKFREHHCGGKQWAEGSWVKSDGEGHQHHICLFESPSRGTDIYAHYEDNVTDPAAHLHIRDDDDDIEGMKRGYAGGIYGILDKHGVQHNKRDFNTDKNNE